MNRPDLIIASRHTSVTAALFQQISFLISHHRAPHRLDTITFSCAEELLGTLDTIDTDQLLRTIVLLDLGSEDEHTWNVQTLKGEQGLAAQLVLSYPEIYFIFIGASGNLRMPPTKVEDPTLKVIKEHHLVQDSDLFKVATLIRFHAQGFSPLFDPTGLRSLLMHQLLQVGDGVQAHAYLPLSELRLKKVAASADDESAFAYLNSYVAYKAGFRVWVLGTASEFWRILPHQNQAHAAGHKLDVIISDWALMYSDQEGVLGKDSLLLEVNYHDSDKLIIITSFQQAENASVWQDCPKAPARFRFPKPYGGIFTLLTQEAPEGVNVLKEQFDQLQAQIQGQRERGQANSARHAAPNARTLVANRLIARARRIQATGRGSTESWVQMAVLTSAAKEILGGMSRTTAYEAISLQNEAEVNAELSFHGISMKIDVKQRLAALRIEGSLTQEMMDTKDRRGWVEAYNSLLNFLLRTVNQLRLRFTEHEQIEAAEECLYKFAGYQHRLQWLHRTSYVDRVLGRRILENISWVFFGYPVFSTRAGTSIKRLLGLSILWIIFFAVCFHLMLESHPDLGQPKNTLQRAKVAAWHSGFTFVELQPGLSEVESNYLEERVTNNMPSHWPFLFEWKHQYRMLIFLELLVAYLHLGLLISLLYRRVTKRSP